MINEYFEMYLSYFDILAIGPGEGQDVKSRKYVRPCPFQKDGAGAWSHHGRQNRQKTWTLRPRPRLLATILLGAGGIIQPCAKVAKHGPGQQVARRESERNPFSHLSLFQKCRG